MTAAESFGDGPARQPLFPEEESVVARAVGKRRREFAVARACARDALVGLGMPAVPILPGERGAPQWPPGIVGSITHCAGYCAAATARRDEMVAIGIDAEPHEPLPAGILGQIARPEELALLARLRLAEPAVHWDRMLFSVKESVYKTWFPLARRSLDFTEASVTAFPGPGQGSFTARLLVPAPQVFPGCLLRGRWLVGHGLVLTAIAVPVQHQEPR